MKALIPVVGFCFLSSLAALQGAEHSGPYAKFDIGGTLQQDLKIRTLDGVTAPNSKFTFDPGVRFDVAGGYNFNESLAVELELGMTYNQVDQIRLFGTALPRVEPDRPFFGRDDEDRDEHALGFYQVPIMANVIYTLPLSSRVRPFIGVGAGGIASIFERDRRHDSDSDSDFTFGYQGQAGLTFILNEHMDIGVLYKFMGALPQRFNFDFGAVQTDNTYSHSILAGFNFNF
jgi:opacity protein-like surface antigen